MRVSAINVFNYLLIFHLFGAGFVLSRNFFEFYAGYIFILAFLFFCTVSAPKIYINKAFIVILALLTAVTLLNIYLENNSFYFFLKQITGIFLTGLAYYMLIRRNRYDLHKLFRIYMRFAVVIAVIGLFQEISYLAHFKPGYDYTYFLNKFCVSGTSWKMVRVSSILPEPAHFGAAMTPAIFVSILNIIRNGRFYIGRPLSVFILLVSLLSFSLLTYMGIALSLLLIILNYKNFRLLCAGLALLISFSFFSYTYVPTIRERIIATARVLQGKVPLQGCNLSTFAIVSNAIVAYKSFTGNPLLGSGLGSHPVSYDKYISSIVDTKQQVYLLCKGDAGSMFLRLVSETGLLGLMGVFYFIRRFYVSRSHDMSLWVISNSIFCLFIITLIRMGHYFYNGFFFFIWLYYFSFRITPPTAAAEKSGQPPVTPNANETRDS